MRRTSVLLVALILTLVCAAPLLSAEASAAPYNQSITGRVINDTGASFPGVSIKATNTTTAAEFNATTNATGAYRIFLPAGTYNVTATIANFTSNRTYESVVVRATQDLTGFGFTLSELLGTVGGHITDGTVVMGGVTVTLIGEVNYTGQSTMPFGDYSISGVKPGTYIARASKLGYNDSYHFPAIVVTRGSTTQINFVMTAQFSVLLGKVSVNGVAQENVNVQLIQGAVPVKSVFTDANGNYSISNVIAGDYLLKFTRGGLQDKVVPTSVAPNREQRLDVSMSLTPVEGLKGFIDDLDLTHSLMVVGFVLALGMIGVAFLIANKGKKKPELLMVPEEEEKQRELKSNKESADRESRKKT